MRDGGNLRSLLFANLKYLHHKRYCIVFFEPFCDSRIQDRGRERAEGFATLYFRVQDCLHIGAAWIANNGSVSKSSRTPFHAPLKPSDYISFGHCLRRARTKRSLIIDLFDETAGRGKF